MSQEGAPSAVDAVGGDYGILPAQQLPRGRNALPRDFVLAHQRERLLAGATAALDRVGYASLTIAQVIAHAKVSRKTFYEIFEGKHECVRAAYEAAFDRLFGAIGDACRSRPEWPQGVMGGLGAALDFAAADPARARLLLVHAPSAEPRLIELSLDSQERLATLLRAGRRHTPPGAPRLEVTELALVGATSAVISSALMSKGLGLTDRLQRLRPELGKLLLTPYLGPQAAQALAATEANGSPLHDRVTQP